MHSLFVKLFHYDNGSEDVATSFPSPPPLQDSLTSGHSRGLGSSVAGGTAKFISTSVAPPLSVDGIELPQGKFQGPFLFQKYHI